MERVKHYEFVEFIIYGFIVFVLSTKEIHVGHLWCISESSPILIVWLNDPLCAGLLYAVP